MSAQEQFGQITGLVTDNTGGAVPEAKVDAVNESTGIVQSTSTNGQGIYVVPSLIPGKYRIAVSRSGFKSSNQVGITLDVSQVARVDIRLDVGDVSQEVTVSGVSLMLQTESASVGTTVTESGAVNLPLNGRNYLQLSTLTPGVTAPGGLGTNANGFISNRLVISGLDSFQISFALDGVDVGYQQGQGTAFMPAPDAIQEFKMDTNNMSVRNGAGGAAINVILKSGTNEYHGDAYEFFRNDALNARNFFALGTPELRQNQFGATFGGPIRRNKTFFFLDYQGTRVLNGITNNTLVPTVLQRTGNFAGSAQLKNPYSGQPIPNNQIPASEISAPAAFFLPFMPLPNTPGGTYVFSEAASNRTDQFDIRVDHQLRPADALNFSYSFQQQSVFTPGAYPQNGGLDVANRAQAGIANWTHTFGPTVINQAHAAINRFKALETPQGLGANYTVESGIGGFEQVSSFPGFPQLTISGYGGINGNLIAPLRQGPQIWTTGDLLTLVRGRHTIDIGADARWFHKDFYQDLDSRGSFTFTGTYTGNALGDYLYGIPFSGIRSFPQTLSGELDRNQDAFVQDTWRVSSRLTLIAGIRYDLIHPFTVLHNAVATVSPAFNQIVVASDSAGHFNTTSQPVTQVILPIFQSRIVPSSQVGLGPSLEYSNTRNFAPRLGVAYDLGHAFVMRAGYGIFYALTPPSSQLSEVITNPPYEAVESATNTSPTPTLTMATIFPPIGPSGFSLLPVNPYDLNPNEPNPYVQQWNFSLQKVISRVISVQASYVGNKGTHFQYALPNNVPDPGPGTIQTRRPNPFFAGGNHIDNTGTSSYDALQMTAEMRSWHGLYMLAGYAWGKILDNDWDNPGASPVQDPNNARAEWAVSSINIASRFTLASVYEIPFLRTGSNLMRNLLGNWSISNIITIQSGPPFTPTISTDPANTGTTERPNQIASGTLPNPTINQWFNAAAFTVPANYTYGNSARDILTGPGLTDWDVSLFKDFKLSWREGMKVQFRGEMYNFTNTPPFGLPQTNIQTPSTVGKVLTAGSARSAQLVLKVLF